MKLPNFKVGDVVMLQSGGKFMTIIYIDKVAQSATCVMTSDDIERVFPLRALVLLNQEIEVLKAGDRVMCRTSYEYMTVIQFDPQAKSALCLGKEARTLPVYQLVQTHIHYE